MKKKIPWLILIVLLLVIDQLSKYLVVQNFANIGDTIPVIDGFFHLTYVRNPGAVFGFAGGAEVYWIFLIVAVIATGVFGYLFAKNDSSDKRKFFYTLAISLLIAGAVGNAIDRVVQFDHRVVDFLDFRGIWDYVFNVADMCLTVGIVVFMVDSFFLEPKRVKQDATQ